MTFVPGVLAWVLGALLAAVGFLARNPWAIPPSAVVAWVALVRFRPYRRCRWCRNGQRRRGRACWRCKGTRMVRRPGAGTVHRVKVVLTDQWREWRDS